MAYINDSVLNCLKKQLCELECNSDKYSKVKAKFLKNNLIPTIEAYKRVDVAEVVHCNVCVRHGTCIFEDTFNTTGLADEHRYCGAGKRK